MCEVDARYVDDQGNAEVKCLISGKPITHSDEYGMYCEDECDRDKDIEAGKALKGLLHKHCKDDGTPPDFGGLMSDMMDIFNKFGDR